MPFSKLCIAIVVNLLISSSACNHHSETSHKFTPPHIEADTVVTTEYLFIKNMPQAWYHIIKIDTLIQSVTLSVNNDLMDKFNRGMVYTRDEHIELGDSKGLRLFADVNQCLPLNYNYTTDNKEDTSISIKAYPIFLVNLSDKFAEVNAQDGSLIMILEAKNKTGIWMPVEYWSDSWCGNSYHSYLLPPNHLLIAKGIMYNGDFRTTARLKLMNDKDSIYSNQFSLAVNLEQFNRAKKVANE